MAIGAIAGATAFLLRKVVRRSECYEFCEEKCGSDKDCFYECISKCT